MSSSFYIIILCYHHFASHYTALSYYLSFYIIIFYIWFYFMSSLFYVILFYVIIILFHFMSPFFCHHFISSLYIAISSILMNSGVCGPLGAWPEWGYEQPFQLMVSHLVYEHSGVSVVPGCHYVHAPSGEFELPMVQFLLRILGKGLNG